MIDLDELGRAIRKLNRQQPLYKVLKTELGNLGYWRDRPRGSGFKKGTDPRRAKLVRDTTPKVGQEAVAAARLLRLRAKRMDKTE